MMNGTDQVDIAENKSPTLSVTGDFKRRSRIWISGK